MRVPLNDLARAAASHAEASRAAFDRVVARGSFVLGDEVSAFEREFADFCGVEHCVGVASGSDALELALRAVGVRAGDDVATVANAAMYASLAIAAIGAQPRYVDIDDRTLTMSPESLASAVGPDTRAVIVTHLYGRVANMQAIADCARRGGIAVVEDCAQAHGARYGERRAGGLGDAGCFSFYPTKNLGALGDGGAVTTRREDVAALVRSLRQYGWDRKYHVRLAGGRNSRLDELQAALLRVRLPHVDSDNARRRSVLHAYANGIRHPQIRVPAAPGDDCVAHLAVVRCTLRDGLQRHLALHGVATDIHYPVPDHRQPVQGKRFDGVHLPVTERACAEVLTLPCFPAMRDDETQHVIDACNAWSP